MYKLIVSSVVLAAAFTASALAMQDESRPPGTPARATDPAADKAFEPLSRDIQILQQSLRNKGGIEESDRDVIRKMRDRAAAFSREYPNDVRGPAMELLLSRWLKDDDLVEQLFARIIQLDPSAWQPRVGLAMLMRDQNRYAEALDILRGNLPDPAAGDKAIAAHLLYANCLFAEHQFEEAVAVLQSLPLSTLPENSREATEAKTLLENARSYQALWEKEQSIRAAEDSANDLPRVMLVTSRGPILLELFENEAPNTVANFIHLAEQGFYNTTKFHRVIANFMAQGGDPNSKPGASGTPGMGDPGYYIPDEHIREDHRNHFHGSLAMAKTEAPNSAGCQFYITVTPTPHLNGKHTVFGRVIEGLEIARSLKQDDVIELVTVLRKRDHEYQPNTLALSNPPVPAPPPPATESPAPTETPPSEPSGTEPGDTSTPVTDPPASPDEQ